jgi:O-succinylbenzoic acid--CoA ligase
VNPLAEALAQRAQTQPGATALVWRDASISFAQLAERAARVARALVARGVAPGDRVAALLPNAPAVAELWHAAIACGAILVPVNTRLAAREIALLLDDAEASLLVHGADDLAALAEAACGLLGGRAPARARAGDTIDWDATAPLPRPADPDPVVAIVYTSGTTGRAKGALLGARNFAASTAASGDRLGVRAGDRWLAPLPLFHVGGLAILARSVLEGVTAIVHERFEPAAVAAALGGGDVRFASLVPAMLERVLRADRPPRFDARRCTVLLGGAAADPALLTRARAAGLVIAPTYGLTEATSQVATRTPDHAGAGLPPLPGVELRIADEKDRPCEAGVAGEIQVRGANVMRGYWRREAESGRARANGWLHTGDVGCLDADGGLHVLARRSDLIVSGGENVYPAEVEAVLLAHPAVREAAVAGVADAAFGARPAAWLVADADLDASALRAFCRARLAGYKVPVAFHRVRELPRNASGKILRDRLGDQSA